MQAWKSLLTCANLECPVPAGRFAAQGSQEIPSSFAGQIPSIAFSVPDLEGLAKLELKAADTGEDLACIQSGVTNGKTLEVRAVSYVAVGIAGAALLLTGLSALGSAGSVGAHSPSVSFSTVIGWFQSMQMNGMMSVNYPPIYRSFTKNFAFSGGLIQWNSMQTSIDNFRNSTGGNLTDNNVQYLRNATLVYTDGSSSSTTMKKRGIIFSFDNVLLSARDVLTDVNGTESGSGDGASTDISESNKATHIVHGVQGYVEQLTIPQANTFMVCKKCFWVASSTLLLDGIADIINQQTVLLVFAIVIAAITVGMILMTILYSIRYLTNWYQGFSFSK